MTADTTPWLRFVWPLTGREFEMRLAEGYWLRAANADDLDAMSSIVSSAYASDPSWAGMTDDIEQRVTARIRARISDPEAHFAIAEFDGEIVGLNGVAVSSPTNMNLITGICVDPKHQGQGLGGALLGYSLAWLRDQGLVTASVVTDPNAVAARIYARFDAVTSPEPDASGRPAKQ